MPVPSQYGDLVSPEDTRAARNDMLMRFGSSLMAQSGWRQGRAPTMGEALGGAMQGLPNWQQTLGGIAERNLALREQRRTEARETARQAILDRLPAGANETPQQTGARLLRMLPEFARIGDMEMVGRLSELLKSMGIGDEQRVNWQEIDAGDRVIMRHPITGEERVYRKGAQPGNGSGVSERADRQYRATVANTIVDDFDRNTRELQLAAQGYGVIRAAGSVRNPAQGIAMLYAYAKLLDPGSVVREGEVATLQRIGSLDERIRQAISQAATGNMSPEITRYIRDQSDAIVRERQSSFRDYRSSALRRAQALGVEVEQYLNDPFARFDVGRAPGAGRATTQLESLFGAPSGPPSRWEHLMPVPPAVTRFLDRNARGLNR